LRRSVLRASIVAAVLALGFAGPVSAGSYSGSLSNFECSLSGGAYGYGFIKVRAQATEYGRSGTNYIHLIFRWQQDHTSAGASWFTYDTKTATSFSYPDEPSNGYFRITKKFSFESALDRDDYWNRIRVRMEFWDERPGSDSLLWTITRTTAKC
jgi:hypothetical protein